MSVIHKIEFVNIRLLFTAAIVLTSTYVYCENTISGGTEPTGLQQVEQVSPSAEVFYAETQLLPEAGNTIVLPDTKEEKDSTEIPPKLEPMVLGGAGAVLLGTGAAVAGVFTAPVLLLAALVLFGVGAFLTAKGWKKIKENPKLFKGEKLAVANYLVIGVVGVVASFYILYFLFTI